LHELSRLEAQVLLWIYLKLEKIVFSSIN
jgi:hypothetical protein